MPPKTRGTKTLKESKENVRISNKVAVKPRGITKRPPRKALADKTNSASDDNINLTTPIKASKTVNKSVENNEEKPRQRRVRKIPIRFAENPILISLSSSNHEQSSTNDTPIKQVKKKLPPKKVHSVKTASKTVENSILKSRPKRISKLPSKQDGHLISPNKFTPLPLSASTPVPNKTPITHLSKPDKNQDYSTKGKEKTSKTNKNKPSPDTNNNGKKQLQIDKCFEKQVESIRKRKIVYNNTTFKLDEKKSLKRNSNKVDPYEFTYDPNEEPPPQKKKRKRTAKKTQTKPKPFKAVYEKNVAKALALLKNAVASNPPNNKQLQVNLEPQTIKNSASTKSTEVINQKSKDTNASTDLVCNTSNTNTVNTSAPCANNYNSVRIEDIVQDLQVSDHRAIDYSPVNSPLRDLPQTPNITSNHSVLPTENRQVNNDDPLNLKDNLSFFDEPIASSSMNKSLRHPLASPWRVEFGSLPIKWQVNTYVKPNMTPAVESSFINIDSSRKHVYTNIVPDVNETFTKDTSLRQTSITSFIKDIADKSFKTKKNSTPVKANSLFEDVTHHSLMVSPTKNIPKRPNLNHFNSSNENMHSTSKKQNGTFFGFDETEDSNQENISPAKNDKWRRGVRTRSRAVLQEINGDKGPSRAAIPISRTKPVLNSDNLKDIEGPKSGLEPHAFVETESAPATTDLNAVNEDAESVHLFEDLDLIHLYHQPTRKSYSKPRKVTFRQNSMSDSDASMNDEEQGSTDEDHLEDLSFKLPIVKPKRQVRKKITKKGKLSKKEEKEVENWAAGFNSMCEDIEEFDLIVE
ncbi:unnamed protein product [Leptosia nina]|uniref:Uncharacterized protein n=1 Tax=Leptosia nina TaxID=320188 RepID=A0AAV1JTW9_9NEOP